MPYVRKDGLPSLTAANRHAVGGLHWWQQETPAAKLQALLLHLAYTARPRYPRYSHATPPAAAASH